MLPIAHMAMPGIIGVLSTALALSGRAVGVVVAVSGALDIADAILRVRNIGVRGDTSRENISGAVASLLNVQAKTVLAGGLAGGGPAVTGIALAIIIAAELLRLALARTNSFREYRRLLLGLWNLVRSAGRGAP